MAFDSRNILMHPGCARRQIEVTLPLYREPIPVLSEILVHPAGHHRTSRSPSASSASKAEDYAESMEVRENGRKYARRVFSRDPACRSTDDPEVRALERAVQTFPRPNRRARHAKSP